MKKVDLSSTQGALCTVSVFFILHFTYLGLRTQSCIAKNGGGYTQRGVAKGLKVPCLFMITEMSRPIRCQKTPEVGIRRIPPAAQYTTAAYAPNATALPTGLSKYMYINNLRSSLR